MYYNKPFKDQEDTGVLFQTCVFLQSTEVIPDQTLTQHVQYTCLHCCDLVLQPTKEAVVSTTVDTNERGCITLYLQPSYFLPRYQMNQVKYIFSVICQ